MVFGFDGSRLYVLLVERGEGPYTGMWALPGGFLDVLNDETIEDCAARELAEETNAKDIYLRQFHVFSAMHRDPRERVITVAFLALVRKDDRDIKGGSDARRAEWHPLDSLPALAFDHAEIIAMARTCLQEILRIEPIAFRLLNERFFMSELQALYELINDTRYDRRNFAKKMLATGMIDDRGPSPSPVHGKFPTLYSFNVDKYHQYLLNAPKRKFLFDF